VARRAEHHGDAAPLILIGYAAIMLPELGKFLPDRSVIFVEEPDVIRKRSLGDHDSWPCCASRSSGLPA
jgi:hypothetical protein